MSQTHFSNIRSEIIHHIQKSEFSIQVAVAWFNDKTIFTSLIDALRRGISLKIVLTNDSTSINKSLDWDLIGKLGGKVYVHGHQDATMHHKFCIIDKRILLSGTYNWTYRAHRANKEDLTVFTSEDKFDLPQYQSRFNDLVKNSVLLNKAVNKAVHREKITCEEIKEYMTNNAYQAVVGEVKRSLSGYLFVVFIDIHDDREIVFFSAKASEHISHWQRIEKGFFDPFVIISEKITSMKPIVTISLKEEWESYSVDEFVDW